MKKLKSILSLTLVMLFISAMTFTSCGGKKGANNETETEQAEGDEHPEDGDSTEHPADGDSTEHPADGDSTEHPADN
ncbi:hypothetical protein [Algoriphagus antarcticus]|uniref:Uncharacterized protein n=1 Tax=Algoriphagus antarcticus TaxID=238540 RepID=A0A3E0DU61_9BACT|nr:hypothetical protein [Algoriphagus antarcticus]REG86405.1 hypothetical protein C8N25_112109 [Algoriphagus antarcticus]